MHRNALHTQLCHSPSSPLESSREQNERCLCFWRTTCWCLELVKKKSNKQKITWVFASLSISIQALMSPGPQINVFFYWFWKPISWLHISQQSQCWKKRGERVHLGCKMTSSIQSDPKTASWKFIGCVWALQGWLFAARDPLALMRNSCHDQDEGLFTHKGSSPTDNNS